MYIYVMLHLLIEVWGYGSPVRYMIYNDFDFDFDFDFAWLKVGDA